MTVHLFPPEDQRRDIDDLRYALQEIIEAVRLISRDVSDGLVLQHIGADALSRNHVDLIVSLYGTSQKLQQLSSQLQAAESSAAQLAADRVCPLEAFG